ncbi:MAG: AI-2E family transporter [Lachnospiraceae bacterium]|nr:AI-2E family transporter [Lachnospiraceae bacterium]
MADPGRKLKKIWLLCGITGAVYLVFRYLLPLVVPFLLAYGTALCLRPSVRFFEYRLRWGIRGKRCQVPVILIGTVELVILLMSMVTGIYLVLRKVFEQLDRFWRMFPSWLSRLDGILTKLCRDTERIFGLKEDSLVNVAADMVTELGKAVKGATMPAIMNNSVAVIKSLVGILIFFVLFFIATLLFLQETEEIREKKSESLFHKEFAMIGRRLAVVGNAWLKTQIMILAVTSVLCVMGLLLIRNPYSLLLGIGIGLTDALPFLGSGVILIPWGGFLLIRGEWMNGAILLGLYVVCYFVRQFMETKIMGDKMGLSALETLISMYVGLQLFGFPGVLLGPVGLLVIMDLLNLYWQEERH